MTEAEASRGRASAARVAKWLIDKGRAEDAVAVLSAWAVTGPNDPEGQNLLAEALRINPGSKLAQLAFERMDGAHKGDPAPLDAAIARFGPDELSKLEKEIKRPNFRRAQVGFNNNVKYNGAVYHIQTEDSGLDKPHIITHLFADGGRIIKSHKRTYASEVSRDDVALYVRALMKGQQMEMAIMLREGKFDDIVAGKRMGGMQTLEEPPRVEVQRLATKKSDTVEVPIKAPTMPPPPVVEQPRPSQPTIVRFRLHVVRSLMGGPDFYAPPGDDVVIGAEGAVAMTGERFCHPREAAIKWKDGRLWLEDYEAGNGVFLRIKHLAELGFGDEFIVGDQLLRIEKNPVPNDGPGPGPTYFYSSPKWVSSFRVVQIFEGGARGACVVAHGTTLQIGSAVGDLVFSHDPLVSEQHCLVEEQAGVILLTDLQSRTGVFVRIKGMQELVHGDELMVGRTRMLLDTSLAK